MTEAAEGSPRARSGAIAVGAGIFLSRIAGLVRERAISHYLGLSPAADAFRAALRIPNFLQNLLGEGVLSASLIPVYARLRAEGRHEEASLVGRAIGTVLALIVTVLALGGVVLAEPLVALLAPGLAADTRALTVELVQILFPGIALLVMSAWCLAILNSHRRFFLSYASPVLWNAALIAAAVVAGRRLAGHDDDIATWLAWGAVIGSAAQLLVQVPTVISLLRSARPSLAVREPGVRSTARAFVPVVIGRGSVQLSAFVDQVLASYIASGILAAMFNAQVLAMLPVSLFGMAVSAAELPEMASATGADEARAAHLRARLAGATRRVAFLVIPSAVAFVAIGGPIIALLFQSGRFRELETEIVWIVLAGSAIGLVPSTQGRLLSSAFYALGDTTRPLHAALVRVGLNGIAGFAAVFPLRDALGYGPAWAAFGLTAASGVAAWIEYALLHRWLGRRIENVPTPARFFVGCLVSAALAGVAGWGATELAASAGIVGWKSALVAIPTFGAVYLAIMVVARVPEVGALTRRLRRR